MVTTYLLITTSTFTGRGKEAHSPCVKLVWVTVKMDKLTSAVENLGLEASRDNEEGTSSFISPRL